MQAPANMLAVWSTFNGIPMETLTKAWWYRLCNGHPRQRTAVEMATHRMTYGTGGNCFDLAVWLLDELAKAGIRAHAVGHDLETDGAHVGVVAVDETGAEYLCDLGDQWLQPIRIGPDVDSTWHVGFFPAADVALERQGLALTVRYRRPGGKESQQTYDLTPLTADALGRACHHSQNLLRKSLCECIGTEPTSGEHGQWEYEKGESFWSLPSGLIMEKPCDSREAWAERIWRRTGIAQEIILAAFAVYRKL